MTKCTTFSPLTKMMALVKYAQKIFLTYFSKNNLIHSFTLLLTEVYGMYNLKRERQILLFLFFRSLTFHPLDP